MGNMGPLHWIIILLVVLLLFGATKLPALAKSVGQSARVFKGEMKAMKEDDAVAAQTSQSEAPAQPLVSQNEAQPVDKPNTSDTNR